MNRITFYAAITFITLSISCQNRFPTEKRYWDANDYYQVINEIEYRTPKGEEFPRFSNPETAMVIRKLVDAENYKVILEDPELGVRFKSEVATDFWNRYRDLYKVYNVMDPQDKYIYSNELAEIINFGLGLQVLYFKLGNDVIKTENDSPENREVIIKNEQTLVNNYGLYLDDIIESRFDAAALEKLAEVINTHYHKLIEAVPNRNFNGIRSKAKALQEKVQNPALKQALTSLVEKLDAKLAPVAATE